MSNYEMFKFTISLFFKIVHSVKLMGKIHPNVCNICSLLYCKCKFVLMVILVFYVGFSILLSSCHRKGNQNCAVINKDKKLFKMQILL